jgi:CheY-like chemotaxis protein
MTSQTILIVEDDLPTRELYERELSRCYHVLACANDQDALAAIHMHRVCAIILEPSLPDGRGWDLLRLIRTMPDMQSIPVILCSTLNARRRAMALGATLYLVKPVLPMVLLETLRQMVPAG